MSEEFSPVPGCGICAAIEKIRAGKNPDFVAELPRSYVVLAWQQFYRGYCILFAKRHVTELYLMPREESRALFDEVVAVSEAIAAVTEPWKMNYACLGNTEPHVHWHLTPRYESDPRRYDAIWSRPDVERNVSLADSDRRALLAALRSEITTRLKDARVS